MKKWHGLILAGLLIAICAWPLIAAQEANRPQRQGRGPGFFNRASQVQAIDAMQAELTKMKQAMENMMSQRPSGPPQEMNEEQRNAMRERFMQMRQEREKSIEVMEKNLALFKGARALAQEHDEAVARLQGIRDQAVKEGAKETAALIEALIAEKNKAFEETMSRLEMEPRRGGFGGNRQGRPNR